MRAPIPGRCHATWHWSALATLGRHQSWRNSGTVLSVSSEQLHRFRVMARLQEPPDQIGTASGSTSRPQPTLPNGQQQQRPGRVAPGQVCPRGASRNKERTVVIHAPLVISVVSGSPERLLAIVDPVEFTQLARIRFRMREAEVHGSVQMEHRFDIVTSTSPPAEHLKLNQCHRPISRAF